MKHFYILAGLTILLLSSCDLLTRTSEEERQQDRLRQLTEAVNTYAEQLKQVNTVRTREQTVKTEPTATGGSVTHTLEEEHIDSQEVATLRQQLQRSEKTNETLKERFKEATKWTPPDTSWFAGLLGAATGGGGMLAMAAPFIARLLGQRGRLIDAVQAVKNTLAGDDEDKREAANKAAAEHLNDFDKPVIDKHKEKRRAKQHPAFTSPATAPKRTEQPQV